MTDEFTWITNEFIEENRKLDKTRQFPRKGGPYTKNDRTKRRNEVFRLHFEHGYSAVKIADMMKINRHTINDDVNYWYSKLRQEWKSYDIDSWLMKQIHRMESQRTRLFKEIERQGNFQNKLSLERLIFEIDNKIMQTVYKAAYGKETLTEFLSNVINDWAENNMINSKFIRIKDLTEVSRKNYEKIRQIMEEDRRGRVGKW